MNKQPIVFDIDGTLTSEHYNEDNLLTLKENPAMMLVAITMQAERPLLVSTARPEYLREVTELWLAKHGLVPEKVYMRPNSDEGIPDPAVKFQHLQEILDEYGPPVVWADDNSGNIEMLRAEGIPVIYVNREE
jgi:FMN phosphatase YigB (HAD superfamily)